MPENSEIGSNRNKMWRRISNKHRGSCDSNRHDKFYRNVIWQYGLQIIKYLLPLITLPYLTRVLEPEGYAVYAYVLSFMTFAQTLIDFGFNLSGTKDVAASKSTRELGEITGSITQARCILCVAVGLICAGIAWNIPIMRENAAYSFAAYIAVCGRALAPDFLFQGKEQMGPITTRYFASKGLSTILTFVFVKSASDLMWVPILDVLASAVALIWSLYAGKKLFNIRLRSVPLKRCISDLIKSGYYCLSNMSSITFNGLTTLVIGIAITDVSQVSYWSLAMTSISALQALYQPITTSLYPHMIVSRDFSFAKRLLLKSLPIVSVATLAFALMAEPIMAILGGDDYIDGAYVIRLVSPVLFFSFYGVVLGWPVLGAMGKVRQLTRTTLLSGALNCLLLLAACAIGCASISAFGMIRSITEGMMCLLRAFECYRAVKERRRCL